MVLQGDWQNNVMEVGPGRREEIGSLEILFPPLPLLFLIYLFTYFILSRHSFGLTVPGGKPTVTERTWQ